MIKLRAEITKSDAQGLEVVAKGGVQTQKPCRILEVELLSLTNSCQMGIYTLFIEMRMSPIIICFAQKYRPHSRYDGMTTPNEHTKTKNIMTITFRVALCHCEKAVRFDHLLAISFEEVLVILGRLAMAKSAFVDHKLASQLLSLPHIVSPKLTCAQLMG